MERSTVDLTLLEATRIVARGGDLERVLAALAGHALAATGARGVVTYLLDPVGQLLVPAASAGISPERLAESPAVAVSDTSQLVAQVARERRAMTGLGEGMATILAGSAQAGGALIGLPLVTSDEAGREDIEGVLLASFTGEAPDATASDDPLFALADLSAVAINRARLAHALTERSEWIERLASTDALTGLPNRTTFERMLELEIARATRQSTPLSVVVFDIDGMAAINERNGSTAGDEVLRQVASLLADQVRLVDTIGRLGGDEFGVIAPGGGGAVVAQRITRAAAERLSAGSQPLSLRSAVAIYPDDGASVQELLERATAQLASAPTPADRPAQS